MFISVFSQKKFRTKKLLYHFKYCIILYTIKAIKILRKNSDAQKKKDVRLLFVSLPSHDTLFY